MLVLLCFWEWECTHCAWVADEEEQLAIVSTEDVFPPPVHVAAEMSFQLAVHTEIVQGFIMQSSCS